MQMCIGMNGKLMGIFTLTDRLRSDAAQTVAHLQGKGYHVHMLSGTLRSQFWDLSVAVFVALSSDLQVFPL